MLEKLVRSEHEKSCFQKEKGNRDAQTGFPFYRPTKTARTCYKNDCDWFESFCS